MQMQMSGEPGTWSIADLIGPVRESGTPVHFVNCKGGAVSARKISPVLEGVSTSGVFLLDRLQMEPSDPAKPGPPRRWYTTVPILEDRE